MSLTQILFKPFHDILQQFKSDAVDNAGTYALLGLVVKARVYEWNRGLEGKCK